MFFEFLLLYNKKLVIRIVPATVHLCCAFKTIIIYFQNQVFSSNL